MSITADMPNPSPAMATILEVDVSNGQAVPVKGGVNMRADFDPASLELSYTVTGPPPKDKKADAAERDQTPAQWTGKQTTLSMTLIFDSTGTADSVQLKTDKLVLLTTPASTPSTVPTKAPPQRVVQFSWGNFYFIGSVSSMRQTIDYFAAGGIPKRATVNLSLVGVNVPASSGTASSGPAPAMGYGAGVGIAGGAGVSIGAGVSAGTSLSAGASASIGASAAVGTTPLTLTAAGDTVQGIAAQSGASVSWKVIAANNNIDNPRVLPAGTVIDLAAGPSNSNMAGATATLAAGAQAQVN